MPNYNYNIQDCITFRKTKEAYGGLSNMAAGYPIVINEINIRTSEAIYQACRFPHLPQIQKEIIEQKSPMAAKMKSKPHRKNSREDWEEVKLEIMEWSLKVKLAQNWDTFSKLLLSTGDKPIVEYSHRDTYWGAIKTSNDIVTGYNHLGILLTELREKIKKDTLPNTVPPLNIKDFNLYQEKIPPLNKL